jgi:excisionase family DNA binding protein
MLTTSDVAAMLGIGTQRVRRLASQHRLGGSKVGRDWVFEERDVKKFAELPRLSGGAGHRNHKKQQAAVA